MPDQEHTVLCTKVKIKSPDIYFLFMTFVLFLRAVSMASRRDADVTFCTPTSPFLPAFHFRHLNGIHFFPLQLSELLLES